MGILQHFVKFILANRHKQQQFAGKQKLMSQKLILAKTNWLKVTFATESSI